MASVTDDRKRRLPADESDLNSSHALARPPPKKRFTVMSLSPPMSMSPKDSSVVVQNGIPKSPSGTISNGETEESLDPFKLEEFQKDAAIRQMKEYKREAQRWQYRSQQLEDSQLKYDIQLSAISAAWDQLNDDLKMLITRIDSDDTLTSLVPANDNTPNFLKKLMDTDENDDGSIAAAIRKKSEHIKPLIIRLLDIIEGWMVKRENFLVDLSKGTDPALLESKVLMSLKEEHERIIASYKASAKSVDGLQEQLRSLSTEVLTLRGSLETNSSHLSRTQQTLEDTRMELMRAEKRLDRIQSTVAMSTLGTSVNSSPAPITPATSMLQPNLEAVNTVQEKDKHDPSVEGDKITYSQKLAQDRMKELEEMKEERVALKQEIDMLRLQIANIPDDRIMDSGAYKHLQVTCTQIKGRLEEYEDRMVKIQKENEELQAGRRQFIDQMHYEQRSSQMALETEMRRLESDLTRIRGQRDHFQQLLDEQKANSELEKASMQGTIVLAETRKDRIVSLQTEVQRLKMTIAANVGDREALEFYGSNDEISLVDHLKEKLKQAESKITELSLQLDKFKDVSSSNVDLQSMIASEAKWKQKAEGLYKKLDEWDALYGISNCKDDNQIHLLAKKVAEQAELVNKSMLKIELQQKMESQLLSEIESVGQAYSHLEEQTSQKIFDLAAKEDHIAKLQAEKIKYAQTFAALNKQKDQYLMAAQACKKQNDKQMEHMRTLGEKDKNLNAQLANLEREVVAANNALEVHKTKLQALTQENAEIKARMSVTDNRVTELSNLLREKTKSLDDEIFSRKRFQEERDSLKKTIENLSARVERPVETQVAEELAGFKQLLKCPSCSINFKSHIILRCLHTFCKKCLDARVDTRQRKCATCGETFGINDVKPFY